MEVTPAAYQALVKGVLEGEGTASRAQRRAAFDNALVWEPLRMLIGKVAGGRPRSRMRISPR